MQAGTAVSSRVRSGMPNSVNRVRWGEHASPGWCLVEQWGFSVADRAIARVKAVELRPARG